MDLRVAAVMSLPRVAWTDSWAMAFAALMPFGIPIFTRSQAYWGHCMQGLIEDRVASGCDWVLTMDYDSMMTRQHVERLLTTITVHPEIDALAAYQCRRGDEETPLFGINDQNRAWIDGSPLKVNTAHFGLTLIRCECLKKLPKPWFQQQPDSNGSWEGEDRTDCDIHFWRIWEQAGFGCYIDPLCRIGHLQLFVSEFDEHWRPRHVPIQQWREANLSTRT